MPLPFLQFNTPLPIHTPWITFYLCSHCSALPPTLPTPTTFPSSTVPGFCLLPHMPFPGSRTVHTPSYLPFLPCTTPVYLTHSSLSPHFATTHSSLHYTYITPHWVAFLATACPHACLCPVCCQLLRIPFWLRGYRVADNTTMPLPVNLHLTFPTLYNACVVTAPRDCACAVPSLPVVLPNATPRCRTGAGLRNAHFMTFGPSTVTLPFYNRAPTTRCM